MLALPVQSLRRAASSSVEHDFADPPKVSHMVYCFLRKRWSMWKMAFFINLKSKLPTSEPYLLWNVKLMTKDRPSPFWGAFLSTAHQYIRRLRLWVKLVRPTEPIPGISSIRSGWGPWQFVPHHRHSVKQDGNMQQVQGTMHPQRSLFIRRNQKTMPRLFVRES